MFWVTNRSSWTSIKYTGITTSTSKVHINNMYIKYTFVHVAILLIRQIFGAVPLPVTISFVVEALISGLGPALGFCMGVTTCLPFFLKFPFFPFALLLKLVVLFNHQHLMFFLDFYLHRFPHHEELGNRFRHPLHTIVHLEVLVT